MKTDQTFEQMKRQAAENLTRQLAMVMRAESEKELQFTLKQIADGKVPILFRPEDKKAIEELLKENGIPFED